MDKLRACFKNAMDTRKLDFDGYDRNWPLAFSVSSLDCLGAGGQKRTGCCRYSSASNPKWSPVYFGIRIGLFVLMFFIFLLSAINSSGSYSTRYLCTDESLSLSQCADALAVNLTDICGQARTARDAAGDAVGWSVWECVCPGPLWLAYLTHWTLLIQLAYLFLAAFTTYRGRAYVSSPVPADTPVGPWYVKAVWFLQAIQIPGTFLVFVLYWLLVFTGSFANFVSPLTHGVNFVVAVVDFYLSKQPMYTAHVLWFFGYACLYCLWNVIFWGSGATTCHGENFLYSSLDLNSGAGAWILMVGLLLVVVPLIYGIFTLVINTCRVVGGDVVLPSDDPSIGRKAEVEAEQGAKSSA